MELSMNDNQIVNYHIDDLIRRYPDLSDIRESLETSALLLLESVRNDGKLLVCGNGGSAADADHIVGELMKSFIRERPLKHELQEALRSADSELGAMAADNLQMGIPAIALTQHTALSSAFANDVEPSLAFAQQTLVLGRPGDILWGITTSGNSKNVLAAAVVAKARGLKVLGMTGASGGRLKDFCDVCLRVPDTETYRIQERHLPIYHTLCIIMEQVIFG